MVAELGGLTMLADRDNAGIAPREARTGASAATQAGEEIASQR